MILQRLAEHYDRIIAEDSANMPATGFSDQLVSFCIVIKPDGQFVHFEDLRQPDGKRLIPKRLKLPGQTKSSGSGLNPCFLWDRIGYLLGVSYETDPREIKKAQERAVNSFDAFKKKHLECRDLINNSRFTAVCRFLESWNPNDHTEYEPALREMTRDCGVFRIAGEGQYLHETVPQPGDWSTQKAKPKKNALASLSRMCLVTGDIGPVGRLHKPEIKGVYGADPKGMPLVSFNAPAFTSYGKDQGSNAPVSEITVFKYANTLNHLIRERRVRLGDATIVYWADHHTPVEDAFAFMFSGESIDKEEQKPEEDRKRVEEAKLLLSQLRSGTQYSALKPDDKPTKFFILGLSPNASRLSVRLWIEADASEMLRRLGEHVRDFALGRDDELPPPIWRIAQATGRAESDPRGRFKSYASDSVSPKLAGDLARSVLTGAAYPQSLLAAMVRRIYSDGHIRFERVSAIKACLVRNMRHTSNPQEIPMELDEAKSDVPYRCGRLFAILEKAQSDSAGGELNSTIKDRYFSAASVTPALVFPRLFRLNGHHLNKLETSSKIYYERLIGSIMTAPFEFPRQLSLLNQGKFITGYFQQRQDLYTSKKSKNNEENA
ncbi:MAG: type I-C CRISPR-associated protein Cas8c/Csd1 [Edaphobacter sp.]